MKTHITLYLTLIVSLGLRSQNWSQIGPQGGYFKEFTYHPTDDFVVYAGSDDGGGVWKSTNGGDSWVLTTAGFPNMTGWRIVIDPNSPDTLYACDLYGRYGVLKSVDGAATWELKDNGLVTIYEKMVSGMAIKSSDTLFISTGEGAGTSPPRPGNGVFRSYDGGDTWQEAGLQGKSIPCIHTNGAGTIFAGSEGEGLYYTNNNGITWGVHPEIPLTASVHEIDVEQNVVLVSCHEGIYLSINWGMNFTYLGLIGEFNFDAFIHTISPDVVLYSSTLSGLKTMSSSDFSWNLVSDPFFDDHFVMGIGSNGNEILVSCFSNTEIIRSTDSGLSWENTLSSPEATELNDLIMNPTDTDHMVAALLGTYNLDGNYDRPCLRETVSGGLNWVDKGPDAHALCLTANPLKFSTQYLGTFAQGLYRSYDGFDSFTQLSGPGYLGVADVAVSIEDTSIIILSEIDWGTPAFSVKRSTDGGSSFTDVASIAANRIVFNAENNDTVFIAASDGLYRSTDNGASFAIWKLMGEDCLTLAEAGNSVYVGTYDGKCYRITGETVSDISGPWNTPVQIKSILIQNEYVFLGMNGAEQDTTQVMQGSIWMTSDNGLTWYNRTGDMTSTNIYGSNILISDGAEIYAGTYGGGVFKTSGLNLSQLPENNSQLILQVYPNPASTYLLIRGDIQHGDQVHLIDSKGSLIAKFDANGNALEVFLGDYQNGLYSIVLYRDDALLSSKQFVISR